MYLAKILKVLYWSRCTVVLLMVHIAIWQVRGKGLAKIVFHQAQRLEMLTGYHLREECWAARVQTAASVYIRGGCRSHGFQVPMQRLWQTLPIRRAGKSGKALGLQSFANLCMSKCSKKSARRRATGNWNGTTVDQLILYDDHLFSTIWSSRRLSIYQ